MPLFRGCVLHCSRSNYGSLMSAGSGSGAAAPAPNKNPAKTDIFAPIGSFRGTLNTACRNIDENRSLPYKPRQLSAMARFDRGGSNWAGNGPFGPIASPDLPHLSGKLPGQRRTTREADLSTQQTGAQAPPRLPRPP